MTYIQHLLGPSKIVYIGLSGDNLERASWASEVAKKISQIFCYQRSRSACTGIPVFIGEGPGLIKYLCLKNSGIVGNIGLHTSLLPMRDTNVHFTFVTH